MEPIAIVGIGCRFPGGANNAEAFWQLIYEGKDTITPVPADRLDVDALYDPQPYTPGKIITRLGGFLEGVDMFDATFFGLSPREAVCIDPQQRLLLEVTWEALEDAGLAIEKLAGSPTGVFIGMWTNDYADYMYRTASDVNLYITTGGGRYSASGRLSYHFDLRGPSLTVDTACSSSLVAVHLACQSLWRGESTLALAGGVNLILQPHITIGYSRSKILSADGHCKFGDASADGYVRSEGVGIVVLKPLSQALADADPIYAVIKGSAVNNDGYSSGLLVAPGVQGQEMVLREAYKQADIPPGSVHYVEAHGTGTVAGDAVEIKALGSVLAEARPQDRPCILGSVKTNVGHMEAAAGIAGLIKVALCLKHRVIPPSLHFKQPNPAIPWQELPLMIPRERVPWPADDEPARAGVNSFGITGTNAHIVLEEAPRVAARPEGQAEQRDLAQVWLLPLSARTQPALLALAQRYLPLLDSLPAELFPSLCSSASRRRSHLPARLALLASSPSQAASRLRSFLDHPDLPADHPGLAAGLLPPGGRPRLVWVFPGQGWQFPGMVRPLLSRFPAFQQSFSSCQQALLAAGIPPLDELLAQPERWLQLDVLQPLLFAIQVSLASLWLSWGLLPDALIGHSLGEVAAAHLAGVLSLEQAATIVAERSRLLEQLRGQGAMLSVELSEQEAELLLAQQGWQTDLAVAVSNGPHSSVLAGSRPALDAVERFLQARQVNARWVEVPVASHCGQVEPILPALRSRLAGLRGHQGHLAWYSTV
ncbi:MAG TPA: type I polyketide synthase, partial [Ktedonobacteraceae bacterium]|nr:type I polyketide synthase [Ktedonobacteraceae bacterium]